MNVGELSSADGKLGTLLLPVRTRSCFTDYPLTVLKSKGAHSVGETDRQIVCYFCDPNLRISHRYPCIFLSKGNEVENSVTFKLRGYEHFLAMRGREGLGKPMER